MNVLNFYIIKVIDNISNSFYIYGVENTVDVHVH